MYVPMPILVALAIILLLLSVAAIRRRTARDPLMGAPRTLPPRMPPPAASPPVAAMPPAATPTAPEDLVARILPLLARGQKINAIKLVRDETGMGLKEAKDYVESLE